MLLPEHPEWQQVIALDRQQAAVVSGPPPPAGVVLAFAPMPTNFVPPQRIPPSLARERERRLAENNARYVARFRRRLDIRNEEVFARYVKEQSAALDTDYVRILSAEEARRLAAQSLALRAIDARINGLQLRNEALNSQVKGFSGQAKQDAISQETLLNGMLARLATERSQLAQSVEPAAKQAVAAERARLQAAMEAALAKRRADLASDSERQAQAELVRLQKVPAVVPAIGSGGVVQRDQRETPLPLPTRDETVRALRVAEQHSVSSTVEERRLWQHQRERVIAGIRADVEQAALEVATSQGWKLVAAGTSGAFDATARVRRAVRAQWRISMEH
jgi:hypothetical protein